MSLFNKKKILVTHNGTFHADEIFSTAALSIMLGDNIKVIRTRDPEVWKDGDFVYDIGGEYDPSANRFDHHQKGGAGTRDNGVPYAAFGLVWKTYGEKICGSKKAADAIDESLVQAIDAHDNGLDTYETIGAFHPYTIESVVTAFRPSWKEDEDSDQPFFEVLEFFKKFLLRKIKKEQDRIESEGYVLKAYEESPDKKIVVLEDNYPWRKMYHEFSEPLFVVVPKLSKWNVYCVPKELDSFENRKSLPESWAGLRDEELAKVTGVPDATFCHNGRFLVVAKSKEGAIALAQKALLA